MHEMAMHRQGSWGQRLTGPSRGEGPQGLAYSPIKCDAEGQERASREPALGALSAACCARRAGRDQHRPEDDHLAIVVYTKARVFSQCKPGPRVNQTQTWTSGFMK